MSTLPPEVQIRLAGGEPIEIDGQRLEPDLQLTLAMVKWLNEGSPSTLTLPVARERARSQVLACAGPTIEVGAVNDLTVNGAAGPLRARLYSPK